MTTKIRYGLILTYTGYPPTPHTVEGVPGLYSNATPTLVGEGCPLSIEAATVLAENENYPLALVEVPVEVVDLAKAAQAIAIKASRSAVKVASKTAIGGEIEQIADETTATQKVN